MLCNVSSRLAKEFKSCITIGSPTEIWNRKISYLSGSMWSGRHCLSSNWLISGSVLKRSSWRLLQEPKSTLLLSKPSFITTPMQLTSGPWASFLMRSCMGLHSTRAKTTRKFSIKYWKCPSKSGIRTFVQASKNFCFLFSRKNLTKDLLLPSFALQSRKYLKKYRMKKLVKMKETKTKRVNLATRMLIFLKTQAGLS